MQQMRRVVGVMLAGVFACGGKDEDTAGGSSSGSGSGSTGGPANTTGDATTDPTTAPATDTGATDVTRTTGDAPTSGEPGTTTDVITTLGTDTSTGDSSGGGSSTGDSPVGPMVDVSDPKLYEFAFKASDADPEAKQALGTQLAELDTTVTPIGKLVVYLHGAGAPETCGSKSHGVVLAKMGFHVLHPCYVSDYGVDKCGDDIGGCRLEAFEGVDHHPVIDITPPDSIETRVVRGLEYLQAMHPGGDWQYFIVDGKPRWTEIVISGISHGASSSGVIGMVREVDRAVMLSGPLDTDQAWLKGVPLTPIDRFYGFTHTADPQHPGHLKSFGDMMLPGDPVVVDAATPPYDGSHRLVTSAPTGDGHGSTQAGGASPKDGQDAYLFLPVWRTMYGVE